MWEKSWREQIWSEIENKPDTWDIIIVGGGITGAGFSGRQPGWD